MDARFTRWTRFVILALMALVSGTLYISTAASDNLNLEVEESYGAESAVQPTPIPPTPAPDIPSSLTQAALKFISAREGVPVDQLLVTSQEPLYFPYLDKTYWRVVAFNSPGDQEYEVLVDTQDGTTMQERLDVEQADQAVRQARYGKFEPALYERLQEMGPEETIQVAFWVAGEPKRDEQGRFAELAQRYPEARLALEKSGNPYSVEDDQLRMEIKRDYLQMMVDDYGELVRPFADDLKAGGYAASILEGVPAVTLSLPKQAVFELAARPEVGMVFRADVKEEEALDVAIPSDRAPAVWARGFDGGNGGVNRIGIAVLEAGRIDNTNGYLHLGEIRGACSGFDVVWHKSRVAQIAGSNHATLKGMAPGAAIYDACEDGTLTDIVSALSWAINRVDIVNYSAYYDTGSGFEISDMVFDHYARQGTALIVPASGNENDVIRSPGLGWNVATVGGTNDQNTTSWSDDTMADFSNWRNVPLHAEKPEVVAPAVDITSISLGGNIDSDSGTSYAAPQVAGLAALLIDRYQTLASWPNALMAILMASAVNNVDGPVDVLYCPPDELGRPDCTDGAGAIDAALADDTAKMGKTGTSECTGPCWWGTSIGSSNLPVNRYFYASKGELIRVATAWWSNVFCPNEQNCSTDTLSTDLSLHVLSPGGTPVGNSTSAYNAYELTEFVAPETGRYRIELSLTSGVELYNSVGIAWSKDASYLPDLRNQSSSSTVLYVRNDEHQDRYLEVHYFDANGNPIGYDYSNLGRDSWWQLPMNSRLPYGTVGSGILSGGEDLSVNVLQILSNGGIDSDNAMHTSSVDPAFEQAGSPLYAPALYNNSYGITSLVKVFNPGTSSVNVTLNFKGRSGYSDNTPPAMNVPAHGRIEVSLGSIFGSTWVGSLYATAPDPIAIQVTDTASDQSTRSYNASAGGGSLLYGPAQYRNSWGLTSGIVVQNLSSSQSATVGLAFYNRNGTYATSYSLGTIGARRATGVYLPNVPGLPDGWAGSVQISSAGGQALAAVIQVNYAGKGMNAYNAASLSSSSIILPFAAKNGSGRTSGYVIQNTSVNSANINVAYYYSGGGDSIHTSQYALNAYGALGQFQGNDGFLPDGWQGSVVITADGPWLAAMMRVDTSASNGAYTGVRR
jgi:hypothetical protein